MAYDSRQTNGLGLNVPGGTARHRWLLTEIGCLVIWSTGWECKNKRMHEHFYVIQLLIEADVIEVPPPEAYIKQIRRGWLRQLWPNILVRMCRETDLSANPSRAPVYCGLCIDFWAPQLLTSTGTKFRDGIETRKNHACVYIKSHFWECDRFIDKNSSDT